MLSPLKNAEKPTAPPPHQNPISYDLYGFLTSSVQRRFRTTWGFPRSSSVAILLPDSGKHVQGPLGLPVYIRVATPCGYTLPVMGGRVRLSARHRFGT